MMPLMTAVLIGTGAVPFNVYAENTDDEARQLMLLAAAQAMDPDNMASPEDQEASETPQDDMTDGSENTYEADPSLTPEEETSPDEDTATAEEANPEEESGLQEYEETDPLQDENADPYEEEAAPAAAQIDVDGWELEADAGGVVTGMPNNITFTLYNKNLADGDESSRKVVSRPASVTLMSGLAGSATPIGEMKDDGNLPDKQAGDYVYTLAYDINVEDGDMETISQGMDMLALMRFGDEEETAPEPEESSDIEETGDVGMVGSTPEAETQDTENQGSGVTSCWSNIIHLKVIPSSGRDMTESDKIDSAIMTMIRTYTGRADTNVLQGEVSGLLDYIEEQAKAWLANGTIIYYKTDRENGMITMQLANGQPYVFKPNQVDSVEYNAADTRWRPHGSYTKALKFTQPSETIRFEVFYYAGEAGKNIADPQITFQGNGMLLSGDNQDIDGSVYRTKRRLAVSGYPNIYYDIYYISGAAMQGQEWKMQITIDPAAKMLAIVPSRVPDTWQDDTIPEYKTEPSEPILWLDETPTSQFVNRLADIIKEEPAPAIPEPIVPEEEDHTMERVIMISVIATLAISALIIYFYLKNRSDRKMRKERHNAVIRKANNRFHEKKDAEENDLDRFVEFSDDDMSDGYDDLEDILNAPDDEDEKPVVKKASYGSSEGAVKKKKKKKSAKAAVDDGETRSIAERAAEIEEQEKKEKAAEEEARKAEKAAEEKAAKEKAQAEAPAPAPVPAAAEQPEAGKVQQKEAPVPDEALKQEKAPEPVKAQEAAVSEKHTESRPAEAPKPEPAQRSSYTAGEKPGASTAATEQKPPYKPTPAAAKAPAAAPVVKPSWATAPVEESKAIPEGPEKAPAPAPAANAPFPAWMSNKPVQPSAGFDSYF